MEWSGNWFATVVNFFSSARCSGEGSGFVTLFSAECTIGMVRELTVLKHYGTMAIMHLAAILGGDPGDIRGNSTGFAGLCCQYLTQDGGIGPLLQFRGKIHGERPARFVTSPPS